MKKKFTFLGFLAGCVFPLAGATTAQPLNTPFQIYMQADGDTECHLDKSEMMMKECGRSPSRPVTTLSQVQTILANHLFDQPDWSTRVNANVEVRISATEPYYGHTIDWYVTNKSYTISFMPSDYQYGMGISGIAGRPVFDGAGSRDWFFQLDSTKGQPTNLRFYYLRIQGYVPGAIYLRGDPNDWQKWNGYNLVYGCYFNFSYISGDPVKVRDYSNYNKIYSNSFVRTGYQAFLLDAPKGDDPTECTSWRNEFRYNTPLSCGYHGQAISIFKPYPRTPSARCPALQPLVYRSDNDPELCP